MAVARVACRAQVGLQAPLVHVEVSLASGLPAFCIVGLPATVVKESRERVARGAAELAFRVPRRTHQPRSRRPSKKGGRFDLPIALGILLIIGCSMTISP